MKTFRITALTLAILAATLPAQAALDASPNPAVSALPSQTPPPVDGNAAVMVPPDARQQVLDTLGKLAKSGEAAGTGGKGGLAPSLKDIPADVEQRVEGLRASIRLLFRTIAQDVQADRTLGRIRLNPDGTITYAQSGELTAEDRQVLGELAGAAYRNVLSINSIRVAFQLMRDINDELMRQAEAAKQGNDDARLRNLLMVQAVYIYEMADIVDQFLGGVTLDGKETIERIATDYRARINADMEAIKALQVRAEQAPKGANDAYLARQQAEWKQMLAYGTAELKEWQGLTDQLQSQQNVLDRAKGNRELVTMRRDTARLRLNMIARGELVRRLSTDLAGMDELTAMVLDIPEFPLDMALLKRLVRGAPDSAQATAR